MNSFPKLLLSSAIVILLGACASHDTRLNSTATQYLGTDGSIVTKSTQMNRNYAESISYWDGDGVSGAPSIRISLSQQKAFFYKGGQLVGVSPVSTGRDGFPTPSGSFNVIEKKELHKSNLYGNYIDDAGNLVVANVAFKTDPKPPGAKADPATMPFWMRLTNTGVGMHAGFLPGVPDSHGCIRLPEKMAQVFFANVGKGTPVTISQ